MTKIRGNFMSKIEIKKPKNLGEVLDITGTVLAWAVLIVFFAALPFYFKEGYSQLASNKYLFFMEASKYTAIVVGVFFLLRLCLWGFTMNEIKAYKKIMWMDIFVVSFAVISLISHLLSDFRTNTFDKYYLTEWFYEGSLWGTRGWFMGLMTFLCFTMLYFFISRALIFKLPVMITAILPMLIICQWGILNRYGIAPIDMNYDYKDAKAVFLASVGNINWFCGFTSVIVPLIWGLYLGAKKLWYQILLMIAATISFTMIILNSSDSGYVALAVTVIVMICFAMTDSERTKRCLELLISLFAVMALVGLIDRIFSGARNRDIGLAEHFIGLPGMILLLFTVILYVLVTLLKDRYPAKGMITVRKIFIALVVFVAVMLIVLVVVNTKTNKAVPVIGNIPYFYFDKKWGGGRRQTWIMGLETFAHLSFVKKLFGAGPDCFFYQMISYEDLAAEWNDYYGSARLTNAHNEILTLLTNIGILGTAAFVGIMVTSVRAAFKAAKERPEYICFALAVISYGVNNMFSFQQITNTPFLFLVIGIEAAALVYDDKAAVRLTKKEGKHTIQKGKKSRK